MWVDAERRLDQKPLPWCMFHQQRNFEVGSIPSTWIPPLHILSGTAPFPLHHVTAWVWIASRYSQCMSLFDAQSLIGHSFCWFCQRKSQLFWIIPSSLKGNTAIYGPQFHHWADGFSVVIPFTTGTSLMKLSCSITNEFQPTCWVSIQTPLGLCHKPNLPVKQIRLERTLLSWWDSSGIKMKESANRFERLLKLGLRAPSLCFYPPKPRRDPWKLCNNQWAWYLADFSEQPSMHRALARQSVILIPPPQTTLQSSNWCAIISKILCCPFLPSNLSWFSPPILLLFVCPVSAQ